MASYFSIMLFVVTLATGLIWLVDAYVLAPKREQKLAAAQTDAKTDFDQDTQQKILAQGPIAEFSQSVFPVIAFVFVLRSFLYEPFQIPSGSMMPTLLVGDFILVQKFDYGIRNPVANNILVETNKPKRGDVAVFKYPEDIRLDYIKRIVGLPGDRIIYRNKYLYILPACQDGTECDKQFQEMKKTLVKRGEFTQGPYSLDRYVEDLGGVKHDVLLNFRMPDMSPRYFRQSATSRNDEWVVPEGHYFALGDNRDNSTDSRFWGFVPEENLVGKAVFIWMSFEFERDESDWLPSWVPTNIRFNRIGGIPGASEVSEDD
ncbi:signal peptidase I [Catenovulum sp. 2E275]|uniref:signal peptidase I n=1 Tax=Catenovulum sp. 2E275 TaxID=2980497 RepID=UPI0021CFA3BE|nr:signal peptidase I [Catenovulum sp. 2E275]MCU4675943.1 signal peptidase I [Catenovulum sp. 2E275]